MDRILDPRFYQTLNEAQMKYLCKSIVHSWVFFTLRKKKQTTFYCCHNILCRSLWVCFPHFPLTSHPQFPVYWPHRNFFMRKHFFSFFCENVQHKVTKISVNRCASDSSIWFPKRKSRATKKLVLLNSSWSPKQWLNAVHAIWMEQNFWCANTLRHRIHVHDTFFFGFLRGFWKEWKLHVTSEFAAVVFEPCSHWWGGQFLAHCSAQLLRFWNRVPDLFLLPILVRWPST